jgi:hypothetical protein
MLESFDLEHDEGTDAATSPEELHRRVRRLERALAAIELETSVPVIEPDGAYGVIEWVRRLARAARKAETTGPALPAR